VDVGSFLHVIVSSLDFVCRQIAAANSPKRDLRSFSFETKQFKHRCYNFLLELICHIMLKLRLKAKKGTCAFATK